MRSKVLSGAVILIVSSLIAKFLGAIYRIPLTNIIGTEGIGIYQLVFPIYSLFFILCTNGVCLALSKLIAGARAKKDFRGASSYFRSGLFLSGMLSIFFALFMFFGSRVISLIQGCELAKASYMSLSFGLMFASLVGVFRGLFQGYENMLPSAISTVIEQGVKLVLGLVLASYFLRFGLEFAVMGAVIGISVGELVSLIYLIITFFVYKKKYKIYKASYNFKPLLKLATIITVGGIISPLSSAIESIIIVPLIKGYATEKLATTLYGIQTGMINPLINFPLIIVTAICTCILPAISYDEENKNSNSKELCIKTIKYVFIIILACFVGYSMLSYDILRLLYGKVLEKSLENTSSLLFIISSFVMILTALSTTFTTILQAKDHAVKPVKNLAISVIIKIILTLILVAIPKINILGLALANLVSFGIYTTLNYLNIKKIYNIQLNFITTTKCLLSVIIMALSIALMRLVFNKVSLVISLSLTIVFAGIIYIMLLIVLKVITKQEIKSIIGKSQVKILAENDAK